MNFIPKELIQIKNYLNENNNNFSLSSGGDDPRQDSAKSESKVIQFLQNSQYLKNITIHAPNLAQIHNRTWYDIKINNFYCDIKISDFTSSDNTNAKQAVYYLLTGQETPAPAQQKLFFKALKNNENKCEKRNYFYIVIHKENKTTNIVSLKNISGIKPNPANQPFQCDWKEAIKNPINRDWNEAKKYLLENWARSISTAIANLNAGMPEYYPEFFHPRIIILKTRILII